MLETVDEVAALYRLLGDDAAAAAVEAERAAVERIDIVEE
jgi:hypothetical protein